MAGSKWGRRHAGISSRRRKNAGARSTARRGRTSTAVRAAAVRDKKNRLAKICISIMVVALISILSVQIVQLNAENRSYKEQESQLKSDLKTEKNRTQKLKEKQKYVNSDKYVEDEAKSKLGMAYKNEIIFKEKK